MLDPAPDPALSAALREAYASASVDEVIHHTLELWHPAFTAPIRVIMARGQRPCHIGIWIMPAIVLHAVEGVGGIATPLPRLGDLGYRLHGLWRRVA